MIYAFWNFGYEFDSAAINGPVMRRCRNANEVFDELADYFTNIRDNYLFEEEPEEGEDEDCELENIRVEFDDIIAYINNRRGRKLPDCGLEEELCAGDYYVDILYLGSDPERVKELLNDSFSDSLEGTLAWLWPRDAHKYENDPEGWLATLGPRQLNRLFDEVMENQDINLCWNAC